MRVLIRGAGDLASGIALRLHRAGLDVVMTDLEKPTAIRRTVCFSQALVLGAATVEDVTARARGIGCAGGQEILAAWEIPVLADPACSCREALRPDAARRRDPRQAQPRHARSATRPVVIGVGPGFTAGEDCHAVVETMRGHTLGRVIYTRQRHPQHEHPRPDRGLRGRARPARTGGRRVSPEARDRRAGGGRATSRRRGGGACRCAARSAASCAGFLPEGTHVHKGMKSGDVDPRGRGGKLLYRRRTRLLPSAAAF